MFYSSCSLLVCFLLTMNTAAGPKTSSLLRANQVLPQHQAFLLLQMEVQFDSLTELEAFWSKIPAQVCSQLSSLQLLISGADT